MSKRRSEDISKSAPESHTRFPRPDRPKRLPRARYFSRFPKAALHFARHNADEATLIEFLVCGYVEESRGLSFFEAMVGGLDHDPVTQRVLQRVAFDERRHVDYLRELPEKGPNGTLKTRRLFYVWKPFDRAAQPGRRDRAPGNPGLPAEENP